MKKIPWKKNNTIKQESIRTWKNLLLVYLFMNCVSGQQQQQQNYSVKKQVNEVNIVVHNRETFHTKTL